MTERMSLEEFRRRGLAAQRAVNKYSAQAIVVGGERFDSKAEAARNDYWAKLWAAKAIKYYLRQVPFRLPGGIIYRLDFYVVHLDGGHTYEDVKGVLTRVSVNKIKQVEEIYRIKVELITKGKNNAKPGARRRVRARGAGPHRDRVPMGAVG